MFRIVNKKILAPQVTLFEVEAPRVATRHQAGQFVMLRPAPDSERIPLTVAATNPAAGTITLVVQAVGRTTLEMCDTFGVGDSFASVAGPLGTPTHISLPSQSPDARGTVVCVAGGIGAAPILPIATAFHRAGHRVLTILGARSANLLILEDALRHVSADLQVCTDDGSAGQRGRVTDLLKSMLEAPPGPEAKVDLVVAIGPAIMMKYCAATTLPFQVPTLVSLNTIMVDGTGMCGGCRVTVGGKARYVCVDGPEFDAHQVDFEGMMRRQLMYQAEEKASLDRYKAEAGAGDGPRTSHVCRASAPDSSSAGDHFPA